MSLAAKLADIQPDTSGKPRRGPAPACERLYGPGNLEDWEAVENLRLAHTWAIAQKVVDKAAGVDKPIPGDKFRYHWRRKCSCWPEDVRL